MVISSCHHAKCICRTANMMSSEDYKKTNTYYYLYSRNICTATMGNMSTVIMWNSLKTTHKNCNTDLLPRTLSLSLSRTLPQMIPTTRINKNVTKRHSGGMDEIATKFVCGNFPTRCSCCFNRPAQCISCANKPMILDEGSTFMKPPAMILDEGSTFMKPPACINSPKTVEPETGDTKTARAETGELLMFHMDI